MYLMYTIDICTTGHRDLCLHASGNQWCRFRGIQIKRKDRQGRPYCDLHLSYSFSNLQILRLDLSMASLFCNHSDCMQTYYAMS